MGRCWNPFGIRLNFWRTGGFRCARPPANGLNAFGMREGNFKKKRRLPKPIARATTVVFFYSTKSATQVLLAAFFQANGLTDAVT